MMYANVAVKTKIPSIAKTYTYEVPEELIANAEIGKEVDVPFGRKQLPGVILGLGKEKPDFKIKFISQISTDKPLLTAQGIALALWLSYRYVANLYDCISCMLPKKVGAPQKGKITLDSSDQYTILPSKDPLPQLTQEQREVLDKILPTIKKGTEQKKILLRGVTGSGKTEIYLRLTRSILDLGTQTLFMVPEIALTPQLINRFSTRFGIDTIAIVHSKLTPSYKRETWKAIAHGRKKIIIGSRSAILSPFKNLGAIIIDECHEQSYKQEQNPKYNTIETAKFLSAINNIPLILGSATPTIEQYYEAKTGVFKFLEIKNRISGKQPLTHIVDMREKESKSYPFISKILVEEVSRVLSNSTQAMLYINRRGLSSGMLCTVCGKYLICPHCQLPLTIHTKNNSLKTLCHHCFFQTPLPQQCNFCGSRFIKSVGVGTQLVQKYLKQAFPLARIEIMDKDTTARNGSHEKIYTAFKQEKIDILIGTKMVTKGWDFSNLALTGYLLLDSDMLFPSFRTSENLYQQIVQLAGRSARGNLEGTNIIQTYNPTHPILQAALQADYEQFFQEELKIREDLQYPPFSSLIQIISKATSEIKALKRLNSYTNAVDKGIGNSKIKDVTKVLGPSKCNIYKRKNSFFLQKTYKIRKGEIVTQKVANISFKIDSNLSEFINILKNIGKSDGLSTNIDPLELQ